MTLSRHWPISGRNRVLERKALPKRGLPPTGFGLKLFVDVDFVPDLARDLVRD